MPDILIYGLIAVAVVVLAIVGIAASKPDTFRTARSATVNAAPDKIYPLIADMRKMNTWNPFAGDNPDVEGRYSGPAAGVGSAYSFDGKKSGRGRIEVTDAAAPRKAEMRLRMVKPFACDNAIEFTLQPNGPATDVTWTMHGRQPFLAKLMNVFINCDKMVGGQFDKGLAKLKAMAEA